MEVGPIICCHGVMSQAWGLYGFGTLRIVERVEPLAESFGGHGVEMRFENLRPTDSICFRFEVKFQSLKAVMMIDAVGEKIVLSRFASTDEIHFVKVMQVGYYKALICQLQGELPD